MGGTVQSRTSLRYVKTVTFKMSEINVSDKKKYVSCFVFLGWGCKYIPMNQRGGSSREQLGATGINNNCVM